MADNVEVRFVLSLLDGDQREQSTKFRDQFLRVASHTRIVKWDNGDFGFQFECDGFNVNRHGKYRFKYLREFFGLETYFEGDPCRYDFTVDSENEKMIEHDNSLLIEIGGWDGLFIDGMIDEEEDSVSTVLEKMAKYRDTRDTDVVVADKIEPPNQRIESPLSPPPSVTIDELPIDDKAVKPIATKGYNDTGHIKDQPDNTDAEPTFDWETEKELYLYTEEKSITRKPPPPICEGTCFPPRKELSVLGARPHWGKTSATCFETAIASRAGLKTFYISLDQNWELTSIYLRAYKTKNENCYLLTDSKKVTLPYIIKVITNLEPDIMVFDSLLNVYSLLMPEILDIPTFNQNDAKHWMLANDWLITNILRAKNISGYGILHPSRTEPFQMPHSGLLTAPMYRADILVPQRKLSRRNMLLIDEPWVAKFIKKHPDAILRWCIRDRGSLFNYSKLYRYASTYDAEIFKHPTDKDLELKPCPVVMLNDRVTARNEEEGDDANDTASDSGNTTPLTEEEFIKWFDGKVGDKTMLPQSVVDRRFSKRENYRELVADLHKRGKLEHEGYGERDWRDGTYNKYRYIKKW